MSSLRQLLAAVAARLGAAGLADPGREARLLVAHAAGIEAERLTQELGQPPEAGTEERLAPLLAARIAGQPMAQILGWRDFWAQRFIVTPDVLDPRPETETLIAAALEAPFARLLDLGTGSGAILLSLLAARPAATGLGTDLSEAALDVARRNAAALGLTARTSFLQADWFSGVTGRFDLIVSNPPYIAGSEMAGLDPTVRDWEPRMALTPDPDASGDGLAAYRAIAAGVLAYLSPGGRVMLEIGPSQGAAVAGLLADAGLASVSIRADLDGRDRVVTAEAPV